MKYQRDRGVSSIESGNTGLVGDKPCPARECGITDAITKAEQILKRIDERWPSKTD